MPSTTSTTPPGAMARRHARSTRIACSIFQLCTTCLTTYTSACLGMASGSKKSPLAVWIRSDPSVVRVNNKLDPVSPPASSASSQSMNSTCMLAPSCSVSGPTVNAGKTRTPPDHASVKPPAVSKSTGKRSCSSLAAVENAPLRPSPAGEPCSRMRRPKTSENCWFTANSTFMSGSSLCPLR
ncbi:MAG: hypothetical protein ACI81R_001865 [Bradymonadia bacterium]|jgi:hypothetical protein